MVIADKGYIFKHIREETGSNFQEEIQRRGYYSKTITNYIKPMLVVGVVSDSYGVWNDNY